MEEIEYENSIAFSGKGLYLLNNEINIDIFRYSDIMMRMNITEAFKALANPTRLAILQNLREPERHFLPQDKGDVTMDGVCVGSIQEGVGLSFLVKSCEAALFLSCKNLYISIYKY